MLAAVGEGAAAWLLVLRTDAIGTPGKVGIQPHTGAGEALLCEPNLTGIA